MRSDPSGLTGFPPVLDEGTRVVVLGTMPSTISFEKAEYYGNPRNRFWRLMADLLGVPADASYDARTAGILGRDVGLWDVLARCERRGSADATIRAAEPNDFDALVRAYPGIRAFAFNGAKAAASFDRNVAVERGTSAWRGIRLLRLPSTSPANAAVGYDRLLHAWRAILRSGLVAAVLLLLQAGTTRAQANPRIDPSAEAARTQPAAVGVRPRPARACSTS